MPVLIKNPLDELNSSALYALLGDAWCAQFEPDRGVVYCVESNRIIGEREYKAIVPFLKKGVRPDDRLAVMSAVTQAIQENHFWRMPASLVAALVAQNGKHANPS